VPEEALANATPYLQAFGHTVLAWIWLDIAVKVVEIDPSQSIAPMLGRISAGVFFYHYELPKISAWLSVVAQRDTTCAAMPEAAF
jgi:butyryl-CoA dehydrogenase